MQEFLIASFNFSISRDLEVSSSKNALILDILYDSLNARGGDPSGSKQTLFSGFEGNQQVLGTNTDDEVRCMDLVGMVGVPLIANLTTYPSTGAYHGSEIPII